MPVHGPTALQAKLKLEGRSVLTCGSLGRCRSVGAVMTDVDKPGARRDGHRSSLKRLVHDVHAYHGHRAEELTSRRPV